MVERCRVYLHRSGGMWEAFYYSDGQRIRFRNADEAEALRRAVRSTGYDPRDIKAIRL